MFNSIRVLILSAFVSSNVALAAGSRIPRENSRRAARQQQQQCQRALYGTYEQMGAGSAYIEPEGNERGNAFFDDGAHEDRSEYPQY